MQFYEIDMAKLSEFAKQFLDELGVEHDEKLAEEFNECNECVSSPEDVILAQQEEIQSLLSQVSALTADRDNLRNVVSEQGYHIEVLAQRIEGMSAALNLAIQIADMA